ILTADDRHNEELLAAIATQVGLAAPLPKGLARVRKGKVQAAADRGEQSVRPLALAALLAAYRDVRHPLRLAARRFPDLLHQVHRLARIRDEMGAADGDREVDPTGVLRVVPVVYRVIEALLVPPPAAETSASAGPSEAFALPGNPDNMLT